MLWPAGPVAAIQQGEILRILGWMVVVILPLFIGLPLALWRYRYGKGKGAYRPDWEFSWLLETLVWAVPVVVAGVLAVDLWHATHRLDPYQPQPGSDTPVEVDVIALDWKWLFLYRDQGVASVDELVLPAGRRVSFRLTSDATMQSFIIPRLGGQIYAMAGMATRLNLTTGQPAVLSGRNTQYNGTGFVDQQFSVKVVSPDDYAAWLAQTKGSAPLTPTRYAALSEPGTPSAPISFGSFPTGLFADTIAHYHTAEQVAAQ